MSATSQNQKRETAPAEVVYLPRPSVKPAALALGLLGMLAGTFMGTPYLVAGAAFFLVALIGWIADSRQTFAELPREQQVTTAVVPPLRATESAATAEPAAASTLAAS